MIDHPQELKFLGNNLFTLNIKWHLDLPLTKVKESLCHYASSVVVSTFAIIIIILSLDIVPKNGSKTKNRQFSGLDARWGTAE